MLYNTYEKHKHLIGTTINKWTVLDIVEYRAKDKGYIQAKCQCSCGTIRNIRLSVLVHNKCFDCGCGTQERRDETFRAKYKHLIGETINGWTILKINPSGGGRGKTFAMCQCQCGTVKDVQLANILSGKSKNCGCGRKQTMREMNTVDLTGQKFGKLLVVEQLKERDKFKRIRYRCRCDCGNETVVPALCLTTHHTSSCGCLQSYYNLYIKNFLTEKGILFKPESPVMIDGHRYRFDFYLPQYNLYIEYDGEQHYIVSRFCGEDVEANKRILEKVQERDAIKDKYCADNGINLLRIPYWEKENIETIINNHLQRLNEKGFAKIA